MQFAGKKAPHAVYLRYMQLTCKNRLLYLLLRGKHFTQNTRDST